AWLTSSAFIGVCIAVPLKRQMINIENLKFPSGIAAAETTLALHGEGKSGPQKAAALFSAMVLGATVNLLREGFGLIPGMLPRAMGAVGKYSLGALTIGFDMSLLEIGMGGLIGLRTVVWMALGATICWAGLVPWALDRGYIIPLSGAPNHYL